MIGQRKGEVGGGHEQLVLAFAIQRAEQVTSAAAVTKPQVRRAGWTRARRVICWCRFFHAANAALPGARQSRPICGRFNEPCTELVRVLRRPLPHSGEPEVVPQADPSSTPPVTTSSKARMCRTRFTRSALESYFLVLLVMIVSIWYRVNPG
jgi:hypothetical protein